MQSEGPKCLLNPIQRKENERLTKPMNLRRWESQTGHVIMSARPVT